MPWDEWEDYAAGMYEPTVRDETVQLSAQLLSNPDAFMEAAREMLREWPNAARHNQQHMWSGRNAWLGQATCCYSHGATGAETREAWGTMTNTAQNAANDVAMTVRKSWEKGLQDAQTLPGL